MYGDLLEGCLKKKDLNSARQIQWLVIRDGLDSIGHFWNDHLIRLFAICGNLDESKRIFSKVGNRSIFTWNAIITASQKLGVLEETMDLYTKMLTGGILPDVITYLCMMKACSASKNMDQYRTVHHEVVCRGIDVNINVGSTLVHAYAECGRLEDARCVFDILPSRNVVTWGAMISGYVHNGEAVVGLELFEVMQGEGLSPGNFIFSCLLKACGDIQAIHEGKLLHHGVIRQRLEADGVIESTLARMYLDCGLMEDAKKVFDGLQNHDIISWGVMMSGYVENGYASHAFEVFKKFHCSGLKPNMMIYLPMLQASGHVQNVRIGRLIHHEVTQRGVTTNLKVKNTVIDMYAKCGYLVEAHHIFERLSERDLVSWGALISGYVEAKHPFSAVKLLHQMLEEKIKPNSVILLHSLKASSMLACILQGRGIHELILRDGLECEEALGNALIDMYAQSGDLIDARVVFDSMSKRGELSWGIMFRSYAMNGHQIEVLELFDEMQVQSLKPNKVILLSVLNATTSSSSIYHGRKIHTYIVREGFELDIAIGSAISEIYVKYGSIKEALKVFESLPNQDIISFGTMIEGFALQGLSYFACKLFAEMNEKGIEPNKAIFLSILKACDAPGWGLIVHSEVVEYKLDTDVEIGSTLMNMYSKCGYFDEANWIIDTLEGSNIVSWTALISGHVHQEQNVEAIKLYARMQEKGIQPDSILYTTILTAFMNTGAYEHGTSIHGELVKVGFDCDEILTRKLLATYVSYGNGDKEETMIGNPILRQRSFSKSTQVTEILHMGDDQNLLGHLREGNTINPLAHNSTTLAIQYLSYIVDLLGRVGFLKEAECFINTMPVSPDNIAWITLLSTCKTHGALDLGTQCFLNTMYHANNRCACPP